MNNSMVGTKGQCPKVSCNSSVKYPCLLQHIAKVYVGIQERRIQLYCLRGEERERKSKGKGEFKIRQVSGELLACQSQQDPASTSV